MPASQTGPSARLPSTRLSVTLFLPRPARQSRSRHMLYAVRYAPGGRGNAITNWQCTVPHTIDYKLCLLCTKRLFAKRHPTWLGCWLQALRSHHDRLFATRQMATNSFPGPVWNSARGRFLLPPSRAWNRLPTEFELMRSTPVFKRFLKTFSFQTTYSS